MMCPGRDEKEQCERNDWKKKLRGEAKHAHQRPCPIVKNNMRIRDGKPFCKAHEDKVVQLMYATAHCIALLIAHVYDQKNCKLRS